MKNMKINKIDYSFMQKEKNSSYSLDSSRTADSISDLYNSDSIPLKAEMENNQKNNMDYSLSNYGNSFNIKIEEKTPESEESKTIDQKQFFLFKIQISVTLGIIYLLLFLICIPKRPIIIGEEKSLNKLIENNNMENINILLNNFELYHGDKPKIEIKEDNNHNIESSDDNDKYKNNDYNNSGFLLEYKTDKIYIIRWLIGFLYFTVRCVCFVYSHIELSHKNFGKKKISLIQKISCLVFPLWLFYYDIKRNNVSFTKIKTEIIKNKNISYYVMNKKNLSMIDYVEGIIPTSFYFLLSIVSNGMKKSIGNYLGFRKKITKLV